MKRLMVAVVVVAWLLPMAVLNADKDQDMKKDLYKNKEPHHKKKGVHTGSKEMEMMKQLAGMWEGTSSTSENMSSMSEESTSMHKDVKTVRVKYRLTAGDSAVVEMLFPGTPDEMMSVYYDHGGHLKMTHYCVLGNQPHMKLTGSNEKRLDFVFTDGININPSMDTHMHALTITFVDQDHVIQKWALYENGQEKSVTTITLMRAKKMKM